MFTANIDTPLDREWFYYDFAAGSFHTKKLCSRLYSLELEFYSQKRQIRFLSHPWGSWCQKTRMTTLSCGIEVLAVCSLVSSQSIRVTDRQNYDPQDRATIAASRGKNGLQT